MKMIFILLTTLFMSAMPLHAAYAQDDEVGTRQACSTTYEASVTDAVRAQVKAQGGIIIELKGANAKAFLAKVEELVGSSAPFTADQVVIVRPSSEEDGTLNVGYFNEGCMVNFGHMPAAFLVQLAPTL